MSTIRSFLLIVILSLLIFSPIMSVASRIYSDFGVHAEIVDKMQQGETTHVSHPLYHLAFMLLNSLAPDLPVHELGLLSILLFILPLPVMIFHCLRRTSNGALPDLLLIAIALALMVIGPVLIWTDKPFLLGYINPTVYHNPTLIALRVFALPLSLLALRAFTVDCCREWKMIAVCAAIVVLGTLAKQSYTIVLLPGCCLFALWRHMRGHRVDWSLLVFGICLPGAIVLILQYAYTYLYYDDDSTIAFGILVFMRIWIPTWRVPIQFLLSLVFPLSVYLLFWRQAREHLYLNMSWTVFATSAVISYAFYEAGARLSHGTLLWNSYVTIFLLMFASLLFVLEQHRDAIRARNEESKDSSDSRRTSILLEMPFSAAFMTFALHVLSGLAWYWIYITDPSQ